MEDGPPKSLPNGGVAEIKISKQTGGPSRSNPGQVVPRKALAQNLELEPAINDLEDTQGDAIFRSSVGSESRMCATNSTNSGQPISSRWIAPLTPLAVLNQAELTGASGSLTAAAIAMSATRAVPTKRRRMLAHGDRSDSSQASMRTLPNA